MKYLLKNIIPSLLSTIFPKYCYSCKRLLVIGEKYFCLDCIFTLSKTYNYSDSSNSLINKLSIYYPVKNVSAFLYFDKGDVIQKIVHQFKYQENIKIGKELSQLFCLELEKSNWINDIDMIIPMPLHWIRKIERGYNQSEIISNVIGKHFNIDVNTKYLKRKHYTKTQTKKSKQERWDNVNNLFSVNNVEQLENKHILLVDDIITTGASINACIKALKTIQGIQISIACLAVTEN